VSMNHSELGLRGHHLAKRSYSFPSSVGKIHQDATPPTDFVVLELRTHKSRPYRDYRKSYTQANGCSKRARLKKNMSRRYATFSFNIRFLMRENGGNRR
jgi:hypothetical protein